MISVIIPVYNGERFIEKAIRSAISQTEVTEVVVVNDGSTDGTSMVLERLNQEFSIIQVYQHNNGINRGRSASRNLGLSHAKGEFIAFLDADDYYLENRFTNDFKIFAADPGIEGVYNAIGTHDYRKKAFVKDESLGLFTVSEKINYIFLFEVLLTGAKGHFSIDGLTVKKIIFKKVGYFNENLVVAEDTELIWKMCLTARLEPGIIDKPLAMRGIHENNVFNRIDLYQIAVLKMYESLIIWSSDNNIEFKKIDSLLKSLWLTRYKEDSTLFQNIAFWGKLFLPNFKLLFSSLSIKYFPLVRLRQKLFPLFFK